MRKQEAYYKLIHWSLAIVYMLLIFFLSSRPTIIPLPPFSWNDKVIHFLEYGVLGILILRAFRNESKEIWSDYAHLWTIIITILYAASDEIHQSFVPSRYGDFWDFVADSLGVIFIVSLIWKVRDTKVGKAIAS